MSNDERLMVFLSRALRAAGLAVTCSLVVAAQAPGPQPAPAQSGQATSDQLAPVNQIPEHQLLVPTVHTALPLNIDDYWFAPHPGEHVTGQDRLLASAAGSYAAGNYGAASSAAQQAAAAGGPLESYARFYIGLSQLRLSHAAEADKAFDEVLDGKPQGELSVAARVGKAEAAQVRGDHATAAEIYSKLATEKSIATEDILLRLGRASLAAGDRARAAQAFLRVYYEFPLSDAAASAGAALASLQDVFKKNDYKLDLGRALILFGAKRYAEARSAFQEIQRQAGGDDREVVDLRIAECDFFLKRYGDARNGLQPYLDRASRKAEAKFFYLSATRELGESERSVALTRALVAEFPDSSWSEEALNNLGTHYILTNQDDLAAQAFRELFEKFPNGQHAERAAWKYGWWAYRTHKYAETVSVFEKAAANFPRSDYRPPYLYWAARARERLGEAEGAQARMQLVYTDYMNSYYGRLARKRLATESARNNAAGTAGPEGGAARPVSLQTPAPTPAPPPPNAPIVRRLLAAGLYEDAMSELKYAQKAWGTSPAIEATIAWIYHQRGDLRRGITLMRRAYPQFLSAGGEVVPAEILQVIFPLTYWDPIRKYAVARGLDPYVMAALIAQESTFDAGAHSSANAWGLMQLLPSTGKRLAPAVGVRRFRVSMLTNPDINIRMGMLYFSRLVQQFGGAYYALASYNAGESRVVHWKAERPGIEEEEFIDDIPFPETQNYVKRILGTAEDYRRLYGDGGARPSVVHAFTSKHAPVKAAPVVRTSSRASRSTHPSAHGKKKTTTVHKRTAAKKRPTTTHRATTHKKKKR